jgi:pilus assembly protein CpaF
VTADVERRLVDLLVERPGASHGDLVDQLRREWPGLDGSELGAATERVLARAGGFGSIDRLLDADGVTEIMINGTGSVWIERDGRLVQTDLRLDLVELEVLAGRILDPLGQRVDRLHPMADGRLPDGSRVNVVVPPLALDGPVITIRRFATRPIVLGDFAPAGVVEQLTRAVAQRRTIVISGSTGAGKTTLLNAFGALIPSTDRVITIEDTAELQLDTGHVVRLEARPANAEDVGEVTIRDLVRNALRMRPTRLVIGETRGPEALDLLLALTTGHRGSFTTVHADHPAGAIRRLQLLASLADGVVAPDAIAALIADAVDLVVHVERRGAARVIASVAEMPDDGSIRPTVVWRRP